MSASVIRVKVNLDNSIKPFFIEPMVVIPRKDDLISIENMINEKSFTDKELDYINLLSWHIDFLNWDKDDKGYFVELYCIGE